jgi:MoxR-like ATPase
MKPSLVTDAIDRCIEVKQSLFIWGPPGAGKSAVTKQTTLRRKMSMIDLRLSLLDSVDLRGFPHLRDNRMHFATPIFLPTDPDSTGVLFLDEMNAGTPATQAAAYQLVLDGKLGEYVLPKGWAIIAAGNRETDQGVTYTMPAPLANRFVHIDYDVDFNDWRDWAMKASIKQEVINFINFRPDLLMDFDPDKRAFPTPRSWEFVSKIIDGGQSIEVERALIAGSVGEGAAAELAAFLKIYRNLPNPDAILMNPKKADVPKDLATLYALCGALANRASEANFDRLVEYCDRMKPEFQTLCIRDSVARQPLLANTQTFGNWAIKNKDVLV